MASQVENQARRATHSAGPWVESLARLGYAARGIVYALIGILAIQGVYRTGNTNVDQTSAFQKVLSQPFGHFLLWIIIVGLLGYALWRIILALFNLEGNGKTLQRIGWFISGLSYLVLAYIAYQLVKGTGGGSSNPSDFTAKVFSMPFGTALVFIVGAVIFVLGLYAIYTAFTNQIEKRFQWGKMSAEERRFAIAFGRFGYAARGVVYLIIGYFLMQAAWTYNPSKAKGLGGALSELARSPAGPWLLWIVALGLIAFGIYGLALARYRRINVA